MYNTSKASFVAPSVAACWLYVVMHSFVTSLAGLQGEWLKLSLSPPANCPALHNVLPTTTGQAIPNHAMHSGNNHP